MTEGALTTEVRGGEIFAYRKSFRLTPEQVALALGIDVEQLMQLENNNTQLPLEFLPRWSNFKSIARGARGHVRRAAPLKNLPFARPTCDECGLPLWRPKLRYSKRADQWVYQLFCGTQRCSRRTKIISFNSTGQRVEIPYFSLLPFERPACAECRRHFVLHSSENHPVLGRIHRLYCDNSACKLQYVVHWFSDEGKEVR
jgi:transcriptional regulator with XRE-family HTH domain